MKIGILDNDEIFVERLCEMLRKNYDGIDIFVFPGIRKAQIAAREMDLDMLLINAEKNCKSLNLKNIPEHCRVVVLTDHRSEAVSPDIPFDAICKYQSAEAWGIFLENVCTGGLAPLKGGRSHPKDKTGICLFTSASGGQGTTAAALAFAAYMSLQGQRVLYLDAQTVCANCGEVFSEIICKYGFAYEQIIDFCPDSMDITGEKIIRVLEKILSSGQNSTAYNFAVIDMNVDISGNIVVPLIRADKAVFVSNGEKSSNAKLEAFIKVLPRLCSMSGDAIAEKCFILYNRFGKNGSVISPSDIPLGRLGGITLSDNEAEPSELIDTILNEGKEAFKKLSEELYV